MWKLPIMRLGVGQLELMCGDLEYNLDRTTVLLEEATRESVDALVLPEMTNSGYYFESYEEAQATSEVIPKGPFSRLLLDWSKAGGLVLAGINERVNDDLSNSAAFFADGKHLGTYRKIHLFGPEKNWFKSGTKRIHAIDYNGHRYGAIICFEWNFPDLISKLAANGAEIVLHPLNSGIQVWRDAMRASAIENHVFTASANRVGTEREKSFSGGSSIIAPHGEVLLRMDANSPGVGWVDIPMD